jgi:hypothetical protein
MVIYISLLVCIIGGLAYVLAAKPEFKELGRIACFCGLLAFLLQLAPATVALLGK